LPACSSCCFSILSVRYLWVHKLILFHYRWQKHGKTDRDLGELMHHNPHLKLYPQSFMKGPSLTCGVGSPSCPKIPKNQTVAGSNRFPPCRGCRKTLPHELPSLCSTEMA
jgi:hypothetical protein